MESAYFFFQKEWTKKTTTAAKMIAQGSLSPPLTTSIPMVKARIKPMTIRWAPLHLAGILALDCPAKFSLQTDYSICQSLLGFKQFSRKKEDAQGQEWVGWDFCRLSRGRMLQAWIPLCNPIFVFQVNPL
jgi:hypothetical protein